MRSRQSIGLLAGCVATALLSAVVAEPRVVDLRDDGDVLRIDADNPADRTAARAAVCDFNGDGLLDVLFDSTEGDGPGDSRGNAGEAFVLFGRRGAWDAELRFGVDHDVWILGARAFDRAGTGVACGDVDGDGYDDMLIGAFNADGPGGARDRAGQVHIVFGAAELPGTIDLLTDENTVVYGREAGDGVGQAPAAADINGDGIDDLILSAYQGASLSGQTDSAGRFYVLFGRSSWGATVDLLDEVDVRVYGREDPQGMGGLGDYITTADLNGDGIEDLLAGASTAGGDGWIRPIAGEVHLFWGRQTWPALIDLAQQSSDMMLLGADPLDTLSMIHGIAVGDLDADHELEIWCGAMDGAGPDNARQKSGEARAFSLSHGTPSFVDLRDDHDYVLFGADAGDSACAYMRIGDIDRDGTSDIACASPHADGVANGRDESGEIAVILGRHALPAVMELDEVADNLIAGPWISGNLIVSGLADINGDGFLEILSPSRTDSKRAVFFVSPFDADGDGFAQLRDNCPLVFNPDQVDSVGDRVGDACRADYDGDGQPDSHDCAPADPAAGTPSEIASLGFAAGSIADLHWDAAEFSDEYDIVRGDLGSIRVGDLGTCRNAEDSDLTDTTYFDSETPATGSGFTYLVRGRSLVCPASGVWGRNSKGEVRQTTNHQTCPDLP